MRFFISNDIRKNELLKLIIIFTTLFFIFLWLTNILLYMEIGFSYEAIVEYYRGSEQNFRPPKSYLGLLQEAHFHFFSMAIILVTLTHLILFTGISQIYKLVIIVSSYISGLGDIAGGWLVRFVSPDFAYFKLLSFIVFQITLALMIIIIFYYVFTRNGNNNYNNNYKV